jgi:hypothetical protein
MTANLAFSVPGSRDQVMPRQVRIGPFAELTGALIHQHPLDAGVLYGDAASQRA